MPNDDLDEIDRRLLSYIQSDARLTNIELAEKVGLSPSPCLRRLRNLEKNGIIHASVGKVSFGADKISDNANELLQTIIKFLMLQPKNKKQSMKKN